MAVCDRWYFSKDQLLATPSRKCGIDADKELSYRQQAANFIQDMGQRLQVTQLCINTAIVYMHRFYMFHSFSKFHRNAISACALFLAAKVEEQPRKLEHVIKVAHMCLHRENHQGLDTKSKAYQDQALELVTHENLMLQTLGFNIGVEHPHRFVVNCCQLVRASKDLAQTSYFMATNSLHLTTMCLQYKPTVVACVCIHLACKWSSWEIPTSTEGKDWFFYVDPTVTPELLEQLTSEFLAILDKCPSRLKRKILSHNNSNNANANLSAAICKPLSDENKKMLTPLKSDIKVENTLKTESSSSSLPMPSSSLPMPSSSLPIPSSSAITVPINSQKRSPSPSSLSKNKKIKIESSLNKSPVSMTYAAYKEKKDKERSSLQLSQHQPHPTETHHSLSQPPNQLQPQHLKPPIVSNPHKILSHHPIRDNAHLQQQQTKDNKSILKGEPQTVVNSQSIQSSLQKDGQLMSKHQINMEKQKQMEERNKIRPKNQDHLWDNNRNINSKSGNSFHGPISQSKLSTNLVSESFFDSLVNKPASGKIQWGNLTSDGDDSLDFKREIVSDLKMEFSDNDSNQSSGGLNLTSLSSAFMNDSAALSPCQPQPPQPQLQLPSQPITMPIVNTENTTINSETLGIATASVSNTTPVNSNNNTKLTGSGHKEIKETKHSHEHHHHHPQHSHEHHDRHHSHIHQHPHHSHKSKHKEKHKSKHKEKHKRKDKDKDKDKDKYGLSKETDPSFKVSLATPKDGHKHDVSHTNSNNDPPREAIKLKISKKQLSGEKYSSNSDEQSKSNKGLKLVISRKGGYST